MADINYKLYYQNYAFVTTSFIKLKQFYYLIYVKDHLIYILAAIDLSSRSIDYLYNHTQRIDVDYSYSLILLIQIVLYNLKTNFLDIVVVSNNHQALSLYLWLGYCFIVQRHFFNYIFIFKNTKINSKNFIRRYLILKHFEVNF